MRSDLVSILACPTCKSSLELRVETEENGEVITGSFHSPTCNEDYPIEDGIPNLLPRKAV